MMSITSAVLLNGRDRLDPGYGTAEREDSAQKNTMRSAPFRQSASLCQQLDHAADKSSKAYTDALTISGCEQWLTFGQYDSPTKNGRER